MDVVRELMSSMGITALYPPQEMAIPLVLEGRNVLLSVPTAAGKSLVAYAALLRGHHEGHRGIYIVPLRALAREKFDEMNRIMPEEARVGLTMGDLTTDDRGLTGLDIVVATSEKADALMRHGNPFLSEVKVCIIDEIHTMTDPRRGPTLEMVLSRMRHRDVQIVALSATIGNASEIAEWLEADLVPSDWRPVRLREGVFHGGTLAFIDGERRELEGDWRALIVDGLENGGQTLVFTRSRREAERLALEMSAVLGLEGLEIDPKEEWGSLGLTVREVIRSGVAFHHAGLGNELRTLVEDAFREGSVRVLFATPTLAAGINLPARRVIILSTKRFERGIGQVDIPVLEIRQMMGRAGRPGLDPVGEAVLVARRPSEARRLVEDYILGEVEPVTSKLMDPRALRVHLLSAIAAGECSSEEDVAKFLSRTFFAHTTDMWRMGGAIDRTLEILEDGGFIGTEGGLRVTRLGTVTNRVYLDPASAALFVRVLAAMPDSPFHHLVALSSAPDMYRLSARTEERGVFIHGADADWLMDLKGGDALLATIGEDDYRDILKTASVLTAWIEEVPEGEITDLFGIGPGDLRNIVDAATWLSRAYAEITALVRPDRSVSARDVSRRVEHGVRPDLLELVRIPGIGRRRGRVLHDSGYHDVASLARASIPKIERLPNFGPATARTVIEWARREGRWRGADRGCQHKNVCDV